MSMHSALHPNTIVIWIGVCLLRSTRVRGKDAGSIAVRKRRHVTGHGRLRMHTSTLRLQVDSEPVVCDGGVELAQEQVLLAAALVRLTVLSIDVNRCSEFGPGPLHVMLPSDWPTCEHNAPEMSSVQILFGTNGHERVCATHKHTRNTQTHAQTSCSPFWA